LKHIKLSTAVGTQSTMENRMERHRFHVSCRLGGQCRKRSLREIGIRIKLNVQARNEVVGKWWRLGLDELRSHEAFGPKAVYLL
jgi:hypothetical protein